jgi:hypothetical protein
VFLGGVVFVVTCVVVCPSCDIFGLSLKGTGSAASCGGAGQSSAEGSVAESNGGDKVGKSESHTPPMHPAHSCLVQVASHSSRHSPKSAVPSCTGHSDTMCSTVQLRWTTHRLNECNERMGWIDHDLLQGGADADAGDVKAEKPPDAVDLVQVRLLCCAPRVFPSEMHLACGLCRCNDI